MTETTTDQQTDPDTDAPDDPAAPDSDDASTATDEATRKARTDAAGYRRRLRDTEAERDSIAAERDALLEKVTARQRADVEALASKELVDGRDLWHAVDGLADVLDEAGEVDEAKVAAAAAALVADRPHYRAPRPDMGLGYRGGPVKPAGGWEDVLRGGR